MPPGPRRIEANGPPAAAACSSCGLHAAAQAKAVAHAEDVGDVHLAIVEGLEDAQGFEVAADASGAVVEMERRQRRFVLLDRLGQAVEDAFAPPAFRDLAEFAGHVHPPERAHDRAHPRVVLLQLPDPNLRGRVHASPDPFGMQGDNVHLLLVLP